MKRLSLALLLSCLVGLVAYLPTADFAAFSSAQQHKVERTLTQAPTTPEIVEVDLSLEMVAPTKVKVGDLVVLSVEESNAVNFEWKVLPSTDNFLVIDRGRRAVFSSGNPGEFTFVVAAAKQDQVAVIIHKIQVIGEARSDFASQVVALCEKVASPSKRDDVLLLSQSFASVAIAMEQGKLSTPAEIAEATRQSNQQALGERLSDWEPFAKGLAALLFDLNKAGKLSTPDEHVAIWKEISTVLRAYAGELN